MRFKSCNGERKCFCGRLIKRMDKKILEKLGAQVEDLKQQTACLLDALHDLSDDIAAARKNAMDKMVTRMVDIGNGLMLKIYIAGTELINMD